MIRLNSLILVVLFGCMESIAEDGHCVWYGECGRNEFGKVTNCYYNGTASQLVDEEALKTMESICSMFYNGTDTYTCCAPDQIGTLNEQVNFLKLLLGRCPSCYYNFRSLFCSTACHPHQSRFITVKDIGNSTKYPGKQTVESIINLLANDFPQRILDSCRDVHYPGGNQHSLDSICGRPYNKCTKEALLAYLGVENPTAPFPIYFQLTNDTGRNDYYNQSTFQCSEPVQTPYEHQSACYRFDCPKSPGPPIPPDVPGKYSNTSFRMTQLVIVPDNQTFVKHIYMSPPAPFSEISVGPALELGFLTRVLDFQKNILNIEAHLPPDNRSVHLTDICLKPIEANNTNCVVLSALQFFQNSRENLYKNVTDDFDIFLLADYITHIYQCSDPSTSIDNPLNISCFAEFGGHINPSVVLTNYPSMDGTISARALVITIPIVNSNDTEKVQSGELFSNISRFHSDMNDLAEAWEEALEYYMLNFTDTQAFLREEGRWNELANFSVYYTNEHFIKNQLNNMIWSNNTVHI